MSVNRRLRFGNRCAGRPRVLPVAADAFTHGGVSLHILEPVVVHDPQVTLVEGAGNGDWDLSFSLNHPSTHFGDPRYHFLFRGNSSGTTDFSLGLRDKFVGFGLLGLFLVAVLALFARLAALFG